MRRIFTLTFLLAVYSISHAQSYYPLSIGNRWYYDSSSTGNNIKVLSDSLFPNGLHYYVLNRQDFTCGQYIRVDSHFVYYFDQTKLSDVPLFHLNGSVGDTTTTVGYFFAFSRIILTKIETLTVFGEKTRVLDYRLDGIQQRDISLSEKFGPLKGSYYSDPPPPWPDFMYNLVGCSIGGKPYGFTAFVGRNSSPVPRFQLRQNYPNPFNPTTTIQFTISSDEFVQLTIFDRLGREVATLISKNLSAGEYQHHWNAPTLPTGIYFCRLKVGGAIETKKLVLLQ